MRIVVNDIAASSGGALTVLQSFHRYVRDFDQRNEWIFLLGSDLLDESAHIRTVVVPEVKRSWLRRLVFDLISGRKLISSLMPDAVLSLQNTYTYGVACPQIVYVHQSLPFQQIKNLNFWRREERVIAVYQRLIGAIIKQSIRRADHVIVQTQWIRAAILDQIAVEQDRVTCVSPDLGDLSAYKLEGVIDAAAFIYPTADQRYKNNECIYSACRHLRKQGIHDFSVTMTIETPCPDPNVAAIGRIPREQVLQILSRSTLIFPSQIESYGLPLAEGRALGSLVLAADLPYAREVLDDYEHAYYFDPESPTQLAALMSQVIDGRIPRPRRNHVAATSPGLPERSAWATVVRRLEGSARVGGGR